MSCFLKKQRFTTTSATCRVHVFYLQLLHGQQNMPKSLKYSKMFEVFRKLCEFTFIFEIWRTYLIQFSTSSMSSCMTWLIQSEGETVNSWKEVYCICLRVNKAHSWVICPLHVRFLILETWRSLFQIDNFTNTIVVSKFKNRNLRGSNAPK